MRRLQTVIFALIVVIGTGVLAALWRFWLEKLLDPLLFGRGHDASKSFENIEFIGVSMVFAILAILPAGLFANGAIRRQGQAEEKLRLSDTIIEHANEGIIVTDSDNRIVFVNPAFTSISGYAAQDVANRTPHILASGRHETSFYQHMWQEIISSGRWNGEIWNKRKDGAIYVQWLSIFTLRNARNIVQYHVGFFSDITERKKHEEKIAWQANHDALTGLSNRKYFLDCLERSVLNARLHGLRLAVLFIDLDGFKLVNDTYGHEVGDLLLKWVAELLQKTVRRNDVVARMGGDEFVVMIEISGNADAKLVANKLIETLLLPQRLAGHEIHFGASIGVALFPEDGQEPSDLLRRADEGMYAAKQAGKNTWRRVEIQ